MGKRPSVASIHSWQIEEHIEIPFKLIGTPAWLEAHVDPAALPKERILVVNGPEALQPVIVWLRKQPVLGVDSETGGDNKRDGLDPIAKSSRMLLFQLGTPEMVYLVEPGLVPFFKTILEDKSLLFLTQNGVHDFKFVLAKQGVHFLNYWYDQKKDTCIPGFYDTMLAEQILTAGLFGVSVGLEELAEKYPPHRLISKAVRKEFIDLRGVLEYRHLYYAARDVFLLFDIRAGQMLQVKKYKHMWERMQIEFCAVTGTADAELTGFDFDSVRINRIISYFQDKADVIRTQWNTTYNAEAKKHGIAKIYVLPGMMEEIDLDSATQKLKALLNLGYKLDNVKRESLLKANCELTNLLGEYSKCTKIISTYGKGLLAKKSESTGRLHPEFNQLGSGDLERKKGGKATTIDTGRWSSDAQQFPRPEHILDPLVGSEADTIASKYSERCKEIDQKFQEAK